MFTPENMTATDKEMIAFLMGFSLGASTLWLHFIAYDLIRSKEEWRYARFEKRVRRAEKIARKTRSDLK